MVVVAPFVQVGFIHPRLWHSDAVLSRGDHSMKVATPAGQNREYFFEVDSIKVDQLSTYSGTDTNDVLLGSDQSSFLYGGEGNDVVHMQPGDDVIDGGDGVDVVRFNMNRSDVSITSDENGRLVAEADDIGRNTLHNVELLQFNDQVLLTKLPRDLSPTLFDETAYLMVNSAVAAAVAASVFQSAQVHYNTWGAREGRDPNALFHEAWYLTRNPDVAQAVQNGKIASGFQHFQNHGWAEDRDPSAYMDMSAYLEANPDVASAGKNPLAHYLLHGASEGRVITAGDDAFTA